MCGDKEFSYEMLNAMPFCLAVMYETLRMFPPVEIIPKYTINETTTQGNKYTLPVGTLVDIHAFGVHFHESWGEDRFLFNPKRWFVDEKCADSAASTNALLEDTATTLKSFLKSNKYCFIPFSDGPRSCLGRRFAEVEFMACVVKIVKNYSLSLPPGADPEHLLYGVRGITFKVKNPVKQ